MNEKELLESTETDSENIREFALEEFKLNPISSAEMKREVPTIDDDDLLSLDVAPPQILVDAALIEAKDEVLEAENPIFALLAEPQLPELPKENRARLQMQSPTRLNFYWSIKQNPFQTLHRAFGNTGSYTLVAKLVNQTTDREEFFPVEAEGSKWFDVNADATYRAEIGFYAPNRPFVRVMFSNSLETPRKRVSPHRASEKDWAVSAHQFAEVLDVSGYRQDAFEVALAGDDFAQAESATTNAFSQFIGKQEIDFPSDEIRFALLALASGYTLENLRGHIGASLFAVLQENAEKVSAENALAAVREHFDVFADDIVEEEEIGSAVFGASLVNFPKRARKRTVPKTRLPKLSPISSFSLTI